MDVSLRGTWTAMPEQFLKRGDRQSGFCHAPAEGMTELVTGDVNPGSATIFFQDELDAGDGQASAAFGNENRPILSDRAAGEPILERLPHWRREAGNAMLIAFAVDFESGWTF